MKGFYNWFHAFYGFIEKGLDSNVDRVIKTLFADGEKFRGFSAIEYACGSGLLGRKLARIFKTVEGRDSSVNMIRRARRLAQKEKLNIRFDEGNILDIREPGKSFDYVFVSFALHLFAVEDIKAILARLLNVARKEVIVIDHSLKWGPVTAFIEWIEGSYYDQFIRLDFRTLAKEAGAGQFSLENISDCTVMRLTS